MVVAFYQYEKIKILSKSKKRWFNAVTTGLYLTLGLNLAASLKGMAIIVRWKLLARKAHQLEEVGTNLLDIVGEMLTARKRLTSFSG